MANTYSKVYLQLIFAVKYRNAVLDKSWRGELFSYIAGIINENGCKAFIVNGVEDHVHCLISCDAKEGMSVLVQKIKACSSKWINEKRLTQGRFRWQPGYSVFSYHPSMVETIYKYIENQEEHHRRKRFRKEFLELFEDFEVDYDERYVFGDLE